MTTTKATKAGAKKAAKKTAKASAAKKAVKKPAAKKVAKKPAAKKATKKPATGKPALPAAGDHAGWIALIEARARAAGVKLPKGASAAAIANTEKALGLALPDEVRAWYRAHDGGGGDYILENREFLSLKGIVDQWKIWKGLLDEGAFGDNDHSAPGRGVQKKWWIPEWVPITYDGSGNHHVVDLAPGTGGIRGQILSFWHDDDSREVVGRDLLSWLARAQWGEH